MTEPLAMISRSVVTGVIGSTALLPEPANLRSRRSGRGTPLDFYRSFLTSVRAEAQRDGVLAAALAMNGGR